jgi:hypothetical protein
VSPGRPSLVVAALAIAAVLLPAGSSARSATPYPGLYFVYAMNCTFTVQNDAGQTVSSIAPGTYDTVVRTPVAFGAYPIASLPPNDLTACHGLPEFQLTGPGVNLNTTVYGGCLTDEEYVETFQPNATYTAQDNNQPAVTRTVLTTLAAGTPQPAVQASATSSTASSTSTDIVGSGIVPLRGRLIGTLSAAGKPVLMLKGKLVSSLEAGRYTFTITDRDSKAGFTLQSSALGLTSDLSGVKFTGTHRGTITLKAGAWTYFSGLGRLHRFLVRR